MKDTTDNTHITAEWVRRPLIDLDGVAPADALGDPQTRRKLDDLLIELAGHHVRLSRLGLPSIDPADIRKALGIEAVASAAPRAPARVVRPGPIKRSQLLDELGTALTGGDVDSVAYYKLNTHAVEHFMHNLGDQENARIAQADADAEMKKISPVTTEVRYGIMSDFISLVEDIAVAARLRTAISGKGAFRRFREAVDEDDTLRRRWLGYRTKRHYHLALDWLHANNLRPEGLNPGDYDWEPASEVAHAPAAAPEPAAVSAPEKVEPAPATAPASEIVAEEPPTTGEEREQSAAPDKPGEEVTASSS